MSRVLRVGTGAVLLAWAVALLPLPASAHALAQSSVPAADSTVQQAPSEVTITFGETPDPRLSSITVLDRSGQNVTAGSTQPVPGDGLSLRVALKAIPKGVYAVTWRTVSSVDGHSAAGSFAFGYGVAPAAEAGGVAAQVNSSPPPSALAVAGRWALFAGLVVLAGAAVVGTVVVARPQRSTLLLAAGGWVLAAAGTYMVAESQRSAAGASWGDVFATSLGHTLVWRIVPTAIAGVAVAVALRLRADAVQRPLLAVAGLAAAGAMWVDADASHAGGQAPAAFSLAMQFVHVVAVGVWIGGLAALLLALRGQPSEDKARAVRRMSTAAGVALLLVAGSGIARAWVEVASWNALVSTAFGQLVIIKLALVAVLALLGAVNRWGNVTRASRVLRGLRVVASTEVVVGAAALLVAAALVNIAPPAYAAPAPPANAPLVVVGNDAGTTVRVRLEVSPGTPGFNRFTVNASDYDTGDVVRADLLHLRFAMPARSGLGESTLALTRAGDGSYTGQGANLSVDGAWQVTVLVQRGAQSVEVPLTLQTRSLPVVVHKLRTPGLPALYTVDLTQGRTVQVYLDPDRPGPVIFHATYFDAKQDALDVTNCRITMTPPGGSTTPLATRQLDVGHFVADATVGKGAYRFDITGTTASGETLTTHLDITAGS